MAIKTDTETALPKVSVGIPTYNRPDGLRRTLRCITSQTYMNLEIIISDNASPSSETEEVAREFMKSDSRILFFRQPENRGSVFNFKFVLGKSTGDYFMWAADDDNWSEDFIAETLQVHLSNPDCTLVFSHMEIVDVTTCKVLEKLTPNSLSYDSDFLRVRSAFSDMVPSLIYGLHKMNSVKQVFMVTENFKFDWADVYIVARIAFIGKIFIVPQYLYQAGVVGTSRKQYSLTGKYMDFSLFRRKVAFFLREKFTLRTRFILHLKIYMRSYSEQRRFNKLIDQYAKSE
jgi:glycosyltransferase involved in cell wall biosynthesis